MSGVGVALRAKRRQVSAINSCAVVRRSRAIAASSRTQSPVRAVAALSVVGMILAGVLMSESSASAQVSSRGQVSVESVEGQVVRVEVGDTLWSFAKRYGRSGDVYRDMRDIRRANNLPNSLIHPGQELRIP